jgi:membrane protein
MALLSRRRAAADREDGRPAPDEAPLEDQSIPEPERSEPRIPDPGLGDLTFRDWLAVVKRSGKQMLADNMMMISSALAYSTFFAIPSTLLVVVGLFTLIASPSTITSLITSLHGVMPGQATQLLSQSLHRLDGQPNATLTMTIVGFVLALWSTTGAMTSYMTALNLAYERKDRRNFFKKRFVAVAMVACIAGAFLLIAVFLIFGPVIEKHVGNALGIGSFLKYVWWAAQWPILIGGLLAAFATLLYLGPDVDHPRWHFISPGAVVAVVVWLAASGGFAYYTSAFASYNKTWGSLSAVIVTLTWLWLTALALCFGAELNAEVERTRELRQGKPARQDIQAPPKAA